ncbi:11405_t:CDS:2, partial [Dentiscutata erythropus]
QHVQSAITPNYPIGDSILKPGDQTKITWLEDKNKPLLSSLPKVLIELMTGSDLNQISLQTIATVNAVLKTCDWTVPEVEPAGQSTTRFIITDSEGNYPPVSDGPKPESGKNPGGVGHLVTSTTNNVTTSTNLNNNIETASTTKKNSLTSSNSFVAT